MPPLAPFTLLDHFSTNRIMSFCHGICQRYHAVCIEVHAFDLNVMNIPVGDKGLAKAVAGHTIASFTRLKAQLLQRVPDMCLAVWLSQIHLLETITFRNLNRVDKIIALHVLVAQHYV